MSKALSYTRALRYNRQIVLPQIDLDGQERWGQASVLIVGIGGLGCIAAQQLCSSGIGQITLIDDDTVDVTNLPRQALFSHHQVGMRKVHAARERLHAMNPDCAIHTVAQRATKMQLQILVPGHDIVLDCTDNLDSRNLINQMCYQLNTPLVIGAAIRFEGQLLLVDPGTQSACYRCLSHLMTPTDLSCTEAGIFSPVVNLIGLQQAHIALLHLIDQAPIAAGKLQTYDGLTCDWNAFSILRHNDCSVCQQSIQAG